MVMTPLRRTAWGESFVFCGERISTWWRCVDGCDGTFCNLAFTSPGYTHTLCIVEGSRSLSMPFPYPYRWTVKGNGRLGRWLYLCRVRFVASLNVVFYLQAGQCIHGQRDKLYLHQWISFKFSLYDILSCNLWSHS